MTRPFTKILTACLLLAGLAGCIKEDRSRCNPGVLLTYEYSLNTERTDLFGDEVDKVTVYLFDEQGMYYDSFSDEGPHLTNDWQMRLPLPPGDYTAVVWGGPLGSCYRVGETDGSESVLHEELKRGKTHIDDFMLSAEKEGEPLQRLDALFHGKAEVTSVFQPETATNVALTKDTNLLTVTIEDSAIEGASTRSEAPYRIRCEAANARYRADNRFGRECRTVTSLPHTVRTEAGRMTAETDLLRLTTDRPVRLVIENSAGETVKDFDFVATLLTTGKYSTQEDLDREDTYRLVVRTDGNHVLSVTINGWVPVEIKPVL